MKKYTVIVILIILTVIGGSVSFIVNYCKPYKLVVELKEILEGNVNLETTDGTIFEDFNGLKFYPKEKYDIEVKIQSCIIIHWKGEGTILLRYARTVTDRETGKAKNISSGVYVTMHIVKISDEWIVRWIRDEP